MNNFSTVHVVFAQISSIGAAWRKKFKNLNVITKIRSRVSGDFKPKHPVEYFSPVQPIFTTDRFRYSSGIMLDIQTIMLDIQTIPNFLLGE
jgi:hypothetical protein